LSTEDTHPVYLAEGLHVDEVLGGDVAVLADIGAFYPRFRRPEAAAISVPSRGVLAERARLASKILPHTSGL